MRVATNPVTNSRTEPRRTRRNLTISVSRRSSAAPLSVKNHPHPNPFRAFRVFRGYIREGSHSLCLVTQKRFFRTPPCATRRVLLYYALLFRRNSSDTVRKALGTGRLTRPVYRSNTPAECRESAAGVFVCRRSAEEGKLSGDKSGARFARAGRQQPERAVRLRPWTSMGRATEKEETRKETKDATAKSTHPAAGIRPSCA